MARPHDMDRERTSFYNNIEHTAPQQLNHAMYDLNVENGTGEESTSVCYAVFDFNDAFNKGIVPFLQNKLELSLYFEDISTTLKSQ